MLGKDTLLHPFELVHFPAFVKIVWLQIAEMPAIVFQVTVILILFVNKLV